MLLLQLPVSCITHQILCIIHIYTLVAPLCCHTVHAVTHPVTQCGLTCMGHQGIAPGFNYGSIINISIVHHLWEQQQKGMVIDSLLLHILRSACHTCDNHNVHLTTCNFFHLARRESAIQQFINN